MSLNVERCQQLSEHLRKQDNSFCMNFYFHDCGTPACIAGHAVGLFSRLDLKAVDLSGNAGEIAQALLGIPPGERYELFTSTQATMPWWPKMRKRRDKWTAKDAADVLDAYVLWKLTGQIRPERVE